MPKRTDLTMSFCTPGDFPLSMTHGQLTHLAYSIGLELNADGWRGDTPVIVQMRNGPRAAAAYLHARLTKTVTVPMNPRDSEQFVKLVAKRTGAEHVIQHNKIVRLDAVPQPMRPAGTETIVFTSGTTGESKAVCLGSGQWMSNAAAVNAHHGMDQNCVHVSPLPLFHCNALGQSLWGCFQSLAHYVCVDGLDCNILGAASRFEATHLSLVPTFIERLLATNDGRHWVPPKSLRYIISAAAPLSGELLNKVMDCWGLRVIQGYGLSESTNFSTLLPVDLKLFDYRMVMLTRPSVGCPLPGVEIRVGDHDTLGMVGELFIRSPQFNCLGYLGQTEPPPEWLPTGDLGFYAEHLGRRFYYLTGRVKELIMRGGEKFSPVMIEEELRAVGIGGNFAVVAYPDVAMGEEIGLVAEDDFDRSLLLQVPTHHRPKRIAIAELPRTATGKVQRNKAAEYLR